MTIKKIGIDVSLTGAEKIPVAEKDFKAMGVAADKAAMSCVELASKMQVLQGFLVNGDKVTQSVYVSMKELTAEMSKQGAMANATGAQLGWLSAAQQKLAASTQAAAAAMKSDVSVAAYIQAYREKTRLAERADIEIAASAQKAAAASVRATEMELGASIVADNRMRDSALRTDAEKTASAQKAAFDRIRAKEMELGASIVADNRMRDSALLMDRARAASAAMAAQVRLGEQTMAYNATLATAIKYNAQFNAGLRDGTGALIAHAEKTNLAERMMMRMVMAYAAYKAIAGVVSTFKAGAEFEMLGVAMKQVGENAGYTVGQMRAFEKAMTGPLGVSLMGARRVLTVMAGAQLDLTKAQEMSRMAQDAGKIANINSTEAFERMIQGIVTAQPKMLKTMHILVSFEQGYRKYAKELGIVGRELTENEKLQSRFNETLSKAPQIAGVYEAAFETAGSQILSAQRYADNLRTVLGTVFLPEIALAVTAYAGALKFMTEHASAAAGAITAIGVALVGLGVAWAITKIAASTFTWGALAAAATNPITLGILLLAAAVGTLVWQLNELKKAKDARLEEIQGLSDADLATRHALNEGTRARYAGKVKSEMESGRPPSLSDVESMRSAGADAYLTGLQMADRVRVKAAAKEKLDADAKQLADQLAAAEAKAAAAQLKKDQAALDKGMLGLGAGAKERIANLKAETDAQRALDEARDRGVEAFDKQKIINEGNIAVAALEAAKNSLMRDGTVLSRQQIADFEALIPLVRAEAEAHAAGNIAYAHKTDAIKALAKAQKDYQDVVLDPVAKLNAETDALKRLSLAKKQGKEATDAERIALAGELEVRKLLAALADKNLTLDPFMLIGAIGARQKAGEGKETEIIKNEDIAKAFAAAKQITDRLWRGVQEGLANAIEQGFKSGLRSARDFVDALKNMLINVFSQAMAAGMVGKMRGAAGSFGVLAGLGTFSGPLSAQTPNVANAGATVTGGTGVLGAAAAHPYIAAAVAVVALGAAAMAAAKAAREHADALQRAAKDFEASRAEWGRSLEAFISSLSASGVDRAKRDLEDSFIALGVVAMAAFEKYRQKAWGISAPVTGTPEGIQAFIDNLTNILNNPGSFAFSAADAAVMRATIDDLNRAMAAYRANLEKIIAAENQRVRYLNEDYDVRRLRAQGRTAEADRLAFDQAQARERQALIDSFGPTIDAIEQLTLDNLNLTLAAEAAAYALNSLSTSALNAVSGYKYQAAIFQAANPRGPSPIERAIPFTGRRFDSTASGSTSSDIVGGDTTVTLVLSDGTEIGSAVLTDFGRRKRQGDSKLLALLS